MNRVTSPFQLFFIRYAPHFLNSPVGYLIFPSQSLTSEIYSHERADPLHARSSAYVLLIDNDNADKSAMRQIQRLRRNTTQ